MKKLLGRDLFELLARCKTLKQRKQLTQLLDQKDFLAISECVRTLLHGHVKLTPKQVKRIRQHKNPLKLLAKTITAISPKRDVTVQYGSGPLLFIPKLLTLARAIQRIQKRGSDNRN